MKFFPKDKTALNGRVFRSGLYSAAITAAVLVLAVLVNLLVRALPTTPRSSSRRPGCIPSATVPRRWRRA